MMETLLQDLRYAARMLSRNAAFTAISVLTLAVGIGVNTAAFTAYKAMIARPLDARDPSKMVNMALIRRSGDTDGWFSYPDYEAYRDRLHSFSGVIAANLQNLVLSEAGGVVSQRTAAGGSLIGRLGLLPSAASNVEFASTHVVSDNYFSVLGVPLFRGRAFASSPSVLISENYWNKRFAGDPDVLGKTIRLNGASFAIVGITPHDFVGTSVAAPDFWLPLSAEPLVHPDANWLRQRENECCRMFGRLAPGVSMGQAQAEMNALANNLRTLHSPLSELAKPATAQVWPGSPFPRKLGGGLKLTVLLIMLAVGMVLVVACANVASLQLARATSRRKELSMRLSLGASRPRIIRQLLTESTLLGVLSGIVALFFTWVLLQIGVARASELMPQDAGTLVFHVTPDLAIFVYVLTISLAAGVLFGLAPALESSRSALSSELRTNAGTPPARSRRLRDFLVTVQVAFSLALMIAGSMLIHSSMNSLHMDPGYQTKQVIDLDFQFPEGSRYTADRKSAIVRELRTRLAALPGVAAVTSARAPGTNQGRTPAVPLDQGAKVMVYDTYVQANYFQTLGIPLLAGRGFQSLGDRSAVVSESAAKQLWPKQNPIGRKLRLGGSPGEDGPIYQIVGVARNIRGFELDGSDAAQIYVPLPPDRLPAYPVLVRTRSDATRVMSAVDAGIASIDPNLMASTSTLDELLHGAAPFIASSLAAFVASSVGLLGLLLAAMGIYGTVSYIVALRTREVGIRMAIGAQKGDILVLILRESSRPVLAGLFIGTVLSVGASYLLRGVLYGLGAIDGVSFAGVSLLFLAIALIAAYLPSRRAMGVDPTVALRYE